MCGVSHMIRINPDPTKKYEQQLISQQRKSFHTWCIKYVKILDNNISKRIQSKSSMPIVDLPCIKETLLLVDKIESQTTYLQIAIDPWEVKIPHVSITNIFMQPVIWLPPFYCIMFSVTYYSILHNALMFYLNCKVYQVQSFKFYDV